MKMKKVSHNNFCQHVLISTEINIMYLRFVGSYSVFSQFAVIDDSAARLSGSSVEQRSQTTNNAILQYTSLYTLYHTLSLATQCSPSQPSLYAIDYHAIPIMLVLVNNACSFCQIGIILGIFQLYYLRNVCIH